MGTNPAVRYLVILLVLGVEILGGLGDDDAALDEDEDAALDEDDDAALDEDDDTALDEDDDPQVSSSEDEPEDDGSDVGRSYKELLLRFIGGLDCLQFTEEIGAWAGFPEGFFSPANVASMEDCPSWAKRSAVRIGAQSYSANGRPSLGLYAQGYTLAAKLRPIFHIARTFQSGFLSE